MSSSIGSAYVQIIPTTDGITEDLTTALTDATESASEASGSSGGSTFANAFSTAVSAVGAIADAIGGALSSAWESIGATAEYGDEIDKSSQQLGISAETYQEWDAVLQHSGTSMDAMGTSFRTLANAAQDASDDQIAAFEAIGLSMDDVANMSTDELWAATIEGLQGMEEGTERTAIATDLLGRGAQELGALFNTSSEETQEMIDTVNELGGVMSDEDVANSAAFEDSMQDMETALTGLKNNMLAEFLPGVTSVMDGLTQIFSGNGEEGAAMITEGISSVIDQVVAMLPELLNIGTEILLSLMSSVIENLPTIIDGIASCIATICTYLTDEDNLQTLINGAIQLVLSIVDSLPTIISSLASAIPTVVLALVEALTEPDNINAMLNGAVELFMAIVSAIPTIITEISAALPDIIDNIVLTISGWVDSLWQAAQDLFQGFINGITDSIANIISTVEGVCSDIWNSITGFFGIGSPSRLMASAGGFLMQGMANGINSESKEALNAMSDTMDGMAAISKDGIISSMGVDYSGVKGQLAQQVGTVRATLESGLTSGTMWDKLDNMGIYLDTGALVGQTSSSYNKALGYNIRKTARGMA